MCRDLAAGLSANGSLSLIICEQWQLQQQAVGTDHNQHCPRC